MDPVLEKALGDWPGLDKLKDVQDLLDRNKMMISQINHNHEQRTPEALQQNAVMIRELNSNVTRIVQIYQDVSQNFRESQEGALAPS